MPATEASSAPRPIRSIQDRLVDELPAGPAASCGDLRNSFMLFIKENLHRHSVGWTADGAQAAADALLVILDHRGQGRSVGIVDTVELPGAQRVLGRQVELVDRH